MSGSPPKEQDVEHQSGEEQDQDHMDREAEGAQAGLGDFEVKEQDRWLPIANGQSCLILLTQPILDFAVPCVTLRVSLPVDLRDSDRCTTVQIGFRQLSHSSGQLFSSHDLHLSAASYSPACSLAEWSMIPPSCRRMAHRHLPPTSRRTRAITLKHGQDLTLTFVTLLQSPES